MRLAFCSLTRAASPPRRNLFRFYFHWLADVSLCTGKLCCKRLDDWNAVKHKLIASVAVLKCAAALLFRTINIVSNCSSHVFSRLHPTASTCCQPQPDKQGFYHFLPIICPQQMSNTRFSRAVSDVNEDTPFLRHVAPNVTEFFSFDVVQF